MAASWLSLALDAEEPPIPRTLRAEVDAADWNAVSRIVQTGAGSPVTTSAGRLFDAVSALLGVRARVSYEGQAAAELEGLADPNVKDAYAFSEEGGGEAPLVLDPRPAIRSIIADIDADEPVPTIAARFHNGLARATAAAAERVCRERSLDLVVLSGGVFQNRLLAERTFAALEKAGVETLMPVVLPPNDGGIAFGQVAVAAARSAQACADVR